MKAAEYMFLHACLQQYLSRIELSVFIVNVVRYLLCLIGIITMKKYLHLLITFWKNNLVNYWTVATRDAYT